MSDLFDRKKAQKMRLLDANAMNTQALDISAGRLLSEWDTAGVLDLIANQPTIDAEPVLHGRWERKRNYYYCTSCGTAYKSVHCGPNIAKFKRCPNCGAKMDLEVHDESTRGD